MGKLILETQISIDGFIADSNGGTDWMIWNWGPDWTWDEELKSYHTKLNKSAKAIIISSQMAKEGFNAHWQESASNTNDERYDFAKHIMDTPKYVATNTLTNNIEIPGGWSNTNIIEGNLYEGISDLKKSIDGDIIVYGGATLVSNLIKADLIDEYHLITNPVVLGSGLPIFINQKMLRLENAIPFKCGIVVNVYKN